LLKLATPFRSPHTSERGAKSSAPIRDRSERVEPLLLVEDKPELRAMLRKALERAGYAVDEAADGSAAVTKIRSRRYLLVLSDLKLPGCSGLEVLHQSKQADPTIPVILITAYGSIEEAVAAMKDGAFDFIQKPVDLQEFQDTIRDFGTYWLRINRPPPTAAFLESDPGART